MNIFDYEPITLQQLVDMNTADYEDILSYTWKDGKERDWGIGITDVDIQPNGGTSYNLSWSDSLGDPYVYDIYKHTLIYKMNEGETWQYGLFKKK